MDIAASGQEMNSNGPNIIEHSEKSSKVKIRIRRKAGGDEKEESVRNVVISPNSKTSFNLHKQISLNTPNKHCIIDARSNSPLGHFNKRWMSMSQTNSKSVPTSPNYTASIRIGPWRNLDKSQSMTQSPTWNKNKSNESDTSSITSNDSVFEDSASGISSKSWHPGINYKPTHPLYLPQPDRFRRCSAESGESTTPTPGSPEMDRLLSSPDRVPHIKSKHKRKTTEPASQVELNIEKKDFTDQDKQILEGYFQTSSRTSGQKNFINSAVYKDKDLGKTSIKPLKVKPLTPNFDRSLEEKTKDSRVRVFPDNSPMTVVTDSKSTRVSSLVKHFDQPLSPQHSPRTRHSISSSETNGVPARPSSAGKISTYRTQTLPRLSKSTFPEETSTTRCDFTVSTEVVRSKPYETNLFKSPANRQAFLNSYIEKLHSSSSSSNQLMARPSNGSTVRTPDMKRASFMKRYSEDITLQEMRPMSTSVLLTKQDTFTNDPYKRKSFLNRYLSRQGESSLIQKKITT